MSEREREQVVPLQELSSPTRVTSEADEMSEETPPTSGTSNRADLHAVQARRPLRLPKTADEWVEADELLHAQVVPAFFELYFSRGKNILCNMTYSILSSQFGTRPPPKAQKRLQDKVKQHDRALKRVTALKNSAKQALRRARRNNCGAEGVGARAGEFMSSLREHSSLKRASARTSEEVTAGAMPQTFLEVCKHPP